MGPHIDQGKMLLRVIAKALWVRPGKLLLSLIALTVGATLASAFLSLYFDLPEKMSSEFRTLGPNVVIVPHGEEQTFSAEVETRVAAGTSSDVAILPWLYAIGKVNARDVILAGTQFEHLAQVHPTWSGLTPGTLTKAGVIVGEKAAEAFGWRVGEQVQVSYGPKQLSLPLIAIISTGEGEDSQLIVPLSELESLTGQAGRRSLIQLAAAGSPGQIQSALQGISTALADTPGVEARALRPVVESEARVVMKVRALMLGLAGIVMALVMLGVLTTVSGGILERQKDIGIMKALGGSDAGIASFFLAESSLQALVAASLGFIAGFVLARIAAEHIFHSTIALRWDVAAAVVIITLSAALLATVLPTRWIRGMDAAVILRGE